MGSCRLFFYYDSRVFCRFSKVVRERILPAQSCGFLDELVSDEKLGSVRRLGTDEIPLPAANAISGAVYEYDRLPLITYPQ